MERSEGILREINLDKRSCRIVLSSGNSVSCQYEEQHEPLVKRLLGLHVIAMGEATARKANGNVRALRLQDISRAGRSPGKQSGGPAPQPKNGKELLDRLVKTGLVGLWKDRSDLGNSSTFARKLREDAERRIWD